MIFSKHGVNRPTIMKIFIVEDNPLYSAVLEQNLNTCGYSDIKKFEDGEMCLEEIHNKPDVVLLDYNLGEGKFNGIEIFKEIKKKNKEAKVVLLSGQEDVKIAVESLRLGAFDYIIKGKFAMDNLMNTLHRISRIQKVNDGEKSSRNLRKVFYAGIICFVVLVIITYGLGN